MSRPRYCIGIDLGTTNSAVAYVDTAAGKRVEIFPVPQLVAESTLGSLPTLPSFLYLAGEHEIAPGALALPWDAARTFAVGTFARVQGTRVPGRLVSSAKSWLCHGGVDRTAAILPWGAPPEVKKLSPVDASARYLGHIREAWNHSHPRRTARSTGHRAHRAGLVRRSRTGADGVRGRGGRPASASGCWRNRRRRSTPGSVATNATGRTASKV